MKYKKNDKVVVELYCVDEEDKASPYETTDGDLLDEASILGKLEDFQPKEEKIKFTPEMKKEFNAIIQEDTLENMFDVIFVNYNHEYQNLKVWLFRNKTSREDNNNQLKFVKCLEDPSLIEVVEPEKHLVRVASQVLYLGSQNDFEFFTTPHPDLQYEFTLDEVKEAEKQLGVQGLQAKWHEASEKDE